MTKTQAPTQRAAVTCALQKAAFAIDETHLVLQCLPVSLRFPKLLELQVVSGQGIKAVECNLACNTVVPMRPVSYTHLTLPTNREV